MLSMQQWYWELERDNVYVEKGVVIKIWSNDTEIVVEPANKTYYCITDTYAIFLN